MICKFLSVAIAAIAISSASTANAAVDIHITGSTWGVWITGLFSAVDNPDGSTHYAYADGGSGVPMDFMMTLPDGTPIDGADLNMRMISTDIVGDVGAPELGLTNWSLWVGTSNLSLHIIWNTSASPLLLANLGSSGQDGVDYAAMGLNETLNWTLERPGVPVETFSTNFESFLFTAPVVPEPGSVALLGIGLALARVTAVRRR
jgi:hypothetical protein